MQTEDPYKLWLLQAKHDLAAGKVIADRGYHSTACFCSQQAAEKAIKAILLSVGARRPDTNSVSQLYRILREKAPAAGELPEEVLKLEPYYESARYPSAWPSGTPGANLGAAESREALKIAEQVVQFAETAIRRLLSK
jgi:HEPN domain-containing protein